MKHSSRKLTEELSMAQSSLSDFLGSDMKIYLNLLKSWFKKKISKQDFDLEARNLLCSDSIHLHNNFLLLLLAKCQSFGSSALLNDDWKSSDKRLQDKTFGDRIHASSSVSLQDGSNFFMKADPLSIVPQIPFQMPDPEALTPGYASLENLLPDASMVHGRMLVGAWERGLLSVDDQCVHLLKFAIEILLKNILSSLSSLKYNKHSMDSSFYVGDGGFKQKSLFNYSSTPNSCELFLEVNDEPMLLDDENDVGGYDDDDDDSDGCSSMGEVSSCLDEVSMPHSSSKSSIHHANLFDLFNVFTTRKNIIPCHALYTLNMERIINTMWHPSSQEEEEQADVSPLSTNPSTT
ncbi:hypothetical protein HELRODRAFT_185117 [Helobdella robusta]|uniref:Uncharacterized protein n=1 Tax=Helobdella robusta TaxID=6412 RepID=T1FMF0_HELRO|nr:hypothetical protein HELRODRAFT_185117 [Helobdella robusta]ESN94503.1 hypothetical protein HELRODRAFT_185117 [Helobdella robusta]